MDAPEQVKHKIIEGRDVRWCVVGAAGGAVFAEEHILVSMEIVFDRPVIPVEAQQLFRRSLIPRQAGDEEDDFLFRHLPHAVLSAAARTPETADLPDGRPCIGRQGCSGQNVNAALLDPAVRFFGGRCPRLKGGKPAL